MPETHAGPPSIHQLVNSRADCGVLANHLLAIAEAIMETEDDDARARLEQEYERTATHLSFRVWAHNKWSRSRFLVTTH